MMRHALKGMLAVFLLSTLWGCASIQSYPARSDDFNSELKHLQPYFEIDAIGEFNRQSGEQARKDYRNSLVTARLRAIDIHYNTFAQRLAQESISMNIATDWAVLGLNAAGAMAPTLTSANVLAAISGGIVGAKGAIDKHAFFERAMPALLFKMEALRKERLVIIRTGMNKDTEEYPMIQALSDLEDYYRAGTIPGAIMGVSASATTSINTSEEKLENIKLFSFKTISSTSTQMETLLKNSQTGKLDVAKAKRMKEECWSHAGVPSTTLLADFIFLGEFEKARSDVLNCMQSR